MGFMFLKTHFSTIDSITLQSEIHTEIWLGTWQGCYQPLTHVVGVMPTIWDHPIGRLVLAHPIRPAQTQLDLNSRPMKICQFFILKICWTFSGFKKVFFLKFLALKRRGIRVLALGGGRADVLFCCLCVLWRTCMGMQ